MAARKRCTSFCWFLSQLLRLILVSAGFVPRRENLRGHRNRHQHRMVLKDESYQENRGDARGAALLLENVHVFAGGGGTSNEILNGIDWRIEPRTKWALVGANGSGKSTLLKAIVGESSPMTTSGTIVINHKERVGYLQQSAVGYGSYNRTIYEEASSGMVAIQSARSALARAEEAQDYEAIERATDRLQAIGGYQQEQKVASVLNGLGFATQDFHTKRCHELSGGWQMRVAFARLLLSEPSLCLMDEPSNHLDAAAKKWLSRYLAQYDGHGSMVLVTHDIELLRSMDHIAEIVKGAGKLQLYKSCTYDQYLKLKQERAQAAQTEYERNAQKAAKLQGFVDRFGASATKASAAQSRVKQLERMQREGLLDAPADAFTIQRVKPSVSLPEPPRAIGEVLLSLENADIGHGGNALLANVSLEIKKGMKLLIRGPNGAGKSTVLKALRGTLPLLRGERHENPALRLGMFTQDLAQQLDPRARAVDIAVSYAREGPHGDINVSEEKARNVMGRLGLQGEKPILNVENLSGGEKARCALALFCLKPCNVYLLDEASNHLDAECVEALSTALSEWGEGQGGLVVVSHDKNFCEKIDFTHVATVSDGGLRLEMRGARAEDWNLQALSTVSWNDSNNQIDTSRRDDHKYVDAKKRKRAYNAPKRIAKLEEMIEKLEMQIEDVDTEMLENGTDVGQLIDLTKKRAELEEKVMEYMAEWEELEALLAEVLLSSS